MQIDSSTGQITWTPDSTQGGSHEVEVKVTDEQGSADSQKFMLSIADALNNAPEILSTPIKSVKEGEKYNYRLKVRDKDGDNLEVNLSGLPEGMKTEKVDGDIQLGWTPTAKQAGEYEISITVLDKRGGKAEQEYTLTVKEEVNSTPVIISDPPPPTGTV